MLEKDGTNQSLMTIIKHVHNLVERQDLTKSRQSQNNFGVILSKQNKEVTIREIKIKDQQAEWVEVDRAHMKKYVILYCHGGGFMTGSKEYARTITTKLAMSTSMDVLSFNYRLAPEHPYPAAIEDGMKAWDYLMLLGYGARDIILAGDSAGGNLALAMVQKLKKHERLLPRGIFVMSPWTDLTLSGKTHLEKEKIDPILNQGYLQQSIDAYTGNKNLRSNYISPLFGDFTGFPPTYIQVGENEILLDDSIQLRNKMNDKNVSVHLDIFPGMWHVFQMSTFKTAFEAMDKNAEFIFDICR